MLEYYSKERRKYPEHFKLILSKDQSIKIFNKLNRHFKLNSTLKFKSFHHIERGIAYSWSGVIKIANKGSTLGVICHELGHIRCYRKYNARGHNKFHIKASKPIFKYARKFIKIDNIIEEELRGNDYY